MSFPPHIEARVADAVQGRKRRLKIRTILAAFGYHSRGKVAVDIIRSQLAERGVTLDPPLNAQGTTLDSTVTFMRIGQQPLTEYAVIDDDQLTLDADGEFTHERASVGTDLGHSENDAGLLAQQLESDEIEPELDNGQMKPWDPALIRVESKAFSIRNILDMIDDGEIELAPDFQRRLVWKNPQKSLLIESILLRIPLPAFYFSASESGQLQVIDGLQRLSTIHEFVRGGQPRDPAKHFKLTTLEYLANQLPGDTFAELKDTVWGRRINTTQIQANIVDPQTPPSVKLNIFARINRQGTPLSQQELRHAMSKSRSRHFLARLANSDLFNEATGYAVQNHPRMADREVALRFCAFDMMGSYEGYVEHGSFTELLTATTTFLDSETTFDSRLEEMEQRFRLSMANAVRAFGTSGFRKPPDSNGRLKPLSRPLFDAWSYFLARIPADVVDESAEAIREAYRDLFASDAFVEAITSSTADASKVMYRFGEVQKSLEGVGILNAGAYP